MADSNNAMVNDLPAQPNLALKKLDRLVGSWKELGPVSEGSATFEWMEGGFFLVQHFTFKQHGREIKGVEYIGFDEDTQTLRSHLMDNWGSNFTYTYDIEDDALTIWFGDKGSDNFYQGTFSQDGNSHTGGWQWPEGDGKVGGYELTATRVN